MSFMQPGDQPRQLPPPVDVRRIVLRSSLIMTTTFLFLGLLAVALRIWARFLRRRKPFLEDVLIYIAAIIYMIHATFGILQIVCGGLGTRREFLNSSNIKFLYQMLIATNVTYGIVMTLSKCSILVLYHRMFTFPKVRLAVKIAVVYNIIWGILAVLCIWVTCQPVSFAWDRTDPNGSCGHATIMLLIVGGLDVLGDIVIFVIPITVIKHIQVSKTEKRLLYGLFGVGAISIGGSCVRMTTAFGVLSNLDDTELLTPLVIWTQVEPSLSIIVSCGMLLRPVLNKILPKRLLSSRRTRDGDNAAKRYNIIDGTGQRRTPRDWTEDSTLVKPSATYSLHERDAPPNR